MFKPKMFKNKLSLTINLTTLALICLILNAFDAKILAQTVSAKKTTAPAAAAKKRSLMWKVIGKNNTAYLLGSVHLATKAFFPMPAEIETAFAQSNVLAVEVDITKVDQAKANAFVISNGVYAGDDTLWKHLDLETTEKLKEMAAEINFPADGLAKLKPWLAAMTISIVALQKQGYDLNLGIDKYFLDKAQNKKRVAEIESADFQLQLLTGQTEAEQIKFLSSSVNQSADLKSFGDLLQNSWLQGDAEKLDNAMSVMNQETPEYSKKLLDDRNPKMADFAENCVKGTDKCFVVVGAAHLVGKKGVVEILKSRGYQVEQVSVAN